MKRKFRLLLVEDEPTQRMMLERQLTRAGYVVETAENGEEALSKILEGQYQILLTDWDMPGMDGPTLCKRVREANLATYVYILLLTGHLTTDDVVAGLGAGANDYVKKPPIPAELLARLTRGQSHRAARAVAARGEREDSAAVDHGPAASDTFNRRYLNDQIAEGSRARAALRAARSSAIMADLDRFKRINDERGHQTGDEVLQRFADLAKYADPASRLDRALRRRRIRDRAAGDGCSPARPSRRRKSARCARGRRCRYVSGDLR